jgi:hypothetical protein
VSHAFEHMLCACKQELKPCEVFIELAYMCAAACSAHYK